MAVRSLDLNGAVAYASAAVFAADGRGRVTLWNRAAEKLLGHSAREAIGRACCEVFRPERAGAPTLCYRGCHASVVALDAPMARAALRTRTDAGEPIRLSVSVLVIAGLRDRGPTIMHLLRETAPAEPGADLRPLSRREFDVLRLMGTGMNTRTMAGALGVSDATVRNHVQSILGKLGAHSRLAAVAAGRERRLL